jgi:ADP-heptose:LPS heptosyltransferase
MAIERVLIIKVRALGDTLLATPAVAALRRGLPGAQFTAVVSPAGREVLENNPDLDEILIYNKETPGPGYHLSFLRNLAGGHYDLAVALHASWRTALMARVSGAAQRVVHNHSGANYFSTIRIPFKKESKSAIQRDLDAVRALGLERVGESLIFPLTAESMRAARLFLAERRVDAGRFMVLIPGAGKGRKRWTADAAAAFLDQVEGRLPVRWVVLAGPADRDLAAAIHDRARQRPLVFSRSLCEAGALLSLSRGAVTTDSGPKHLAVAVNVPTLTLWTDEPEAEWHPYDLSRHALLCSPTGLVSDIPVAAAVEATVQHFPKAWKKSA